jgi:FkbM family methyltransferase
MLKKLKNYMFGEYMRRFFRSKPAPNHFYPITKTCQIPQLHLIYEQYFGRRKNGTFVEIGAFDGEYVSNTSGLADIGWKGIYVEPVTDFFEKCKTRHRNNDNVKVVNIAIGDTEGHLTIHKGGPLSTASRQMKDNFKNLEWAKDHFLKEESLTVTMTTLDNLLFEHKIQRQFEILVIDVEGFEWNVLKNFDISNWQPQMVIIELHDQNDDYFHIRERCKKIVRYFDDSYYKIIWKDFTNTIYVKNGCFPIPISQRFSVDGSK